ncbi:MAG: deoxyribodipyrimidine photo-lyase [Polyangiales bacterium]
MAPRTLIWFRRDLRVHDHTALHRAARRGEVVALFVVSPGAWRAHDDAPVKVDFWLRCLRSLADELAARNVPLRVVTAERASDEPAAVVREARAAGCDAVYFIREYEVNERRRDERTRALAAAEGIATEGFDDRVAVPPGEVLTEAGTPYTVFTPFRRRWYAALAKRGWSVLPAPEAQRPIEVASTPVPARVEGFESPVDPALWPAGEAAARRRLDHFTRTALRDYHLTRDLPSLDGTSALSPYLAAGVLSARQCLAAAASVNDGFVEAGHAGPVTWVSELAWRDFYQHVLMAFERVSKGRAFKPETEAVAWRSDPEGLARWREGRTGYPIVDAAMRQLLATGWMHNRMRMVTAMFLTKDLLVDWREGERFFMRHLVDGDLGANNGGWQWSASTGTDAQPYFRVFNPSSQSKRYDPDGEYILRYVPELRGVAKALLHAPEKIPAAVLKHAGYPQRVVDHERARVRAIDAFRAV